MEVDDKSILGDEKPAPLTSERLRNLALDHLLENSVLYLATGLSMSERLIATMELLTQFGEIVATESLANRQNLSDLPTLGHLIPGDPDKDPTDGKRYELRYRVVEQIGDQAPFNDALLTLGDAVDHYGEGFVDQYWGRLGEHCPNRLSVAGDKTMWFTVVRVPVAELKQQADVKQESRSRPAPG